METKAEKNSYQVVDSKTGLNVGKPTDCPRRARNKANKLDQQYGACRYVVKITWA